MAGLSKDTLALLLKISEQVAPSSDFEDVETSGELADSLPVSEAQVGRPPKVEERTRPWDADEFIYINYRPYVYTVTRDQGTLVRFPGGRAIPSLELRYRDHVVTPPKRLRLS